MKRGMRWLAGEREVRRRLYHGIRDYLTLARFSHEFAEYAVVSTTEVARQVGRPPSAAAAVQARILVRVSHDLRVVEWAARNGYVLQALSLAAGVYELSHAIAYIGDSAERARLWEEHADARETYPPLRHRRRAVRATLEVTFRDEPEILTHLDAMVDDQERLYQAFCEAKHGNPRVLRRFGLAVGPDTMTIYHGPFFSRYLVGLAQFAVYHSARMLIGASVVHARPRLGPDSHPTRESFDRRTLQILRRVVALSERSYGAEGETA
jgi:hypothetical protein